MRRLIGSALVSLTTTALAAVLLAPSAVASPIGDAEAAMMAAWDKAGGDTSPLGARKGDVYPVGDGFALDFDGGKMFFTPATGAKFAYGPVLDKYEQLGGPAGSDLGFPTINEVPGLSGPDSRVITFSASDKPVIFWTPEHGPFVVRGALNTAWDKLGSSGGVLGVPVGDETYNGEVSSQKFSGGQVSWNRQTKQFSTDPPALADQLKGLQVAIDPTAAINTAWRAAGGPTGPLGAKQGGQYPVGGDGIAQNFAGGKVFFTPATGANAVESDILAKYESLGGPAGSDLGFPTTNETDGGIGPSSRIVTFSAADKPVIFWTPDHGAFVVRGAMKAAWDKLRAPAGKLGAPVGDQAVNGDMVSQQFTGGKISWNRAKNTFSTEPANLAPLLSGLQVSGQNQPSSSAMPAHPKKFTWHWWWLMAAIPVLVLLVLLVWVLFVWRRRRPRPEDAAGYAPGHGGDFGVDPDGRWAHDDSDHEAEPFGLSAPHQPEPEREAARVGWQRQVPAESDYGFEEEDPDAVDTDSIPVVSEEMLSEAEYSDAGADYTDYTDAVPEVAESETADDAAYVDADDPDAGYAEEEVYDEDEYPDVAVPRTPPDSDAVTGALETAEPQDEYLELATPEPAADTAAGADVAEAVVAGAVAAGTPARSGRHAAADAEDGSENGLAGPDGRPTIHLPLDDPYQAPDGYPIKASARYGLYYTPDSDLYQDTLAEIWLSSEEVAQANGFTRAD
ncbi:LGFP repeat-containing protein [Mycobacterium sp. M23085]|uniref:LGFP repeat-containing protein n=1 Tax=Mycobacterium sp. M23085 TaxID=3378087 RepID=UPI003877C86C